MVASCFEAVKRQVEDLTPEELDDMLLEMRRRQRSYMQKGMPAQEAGQKAAQTVSNDLKLAAAIEKRNAAINLRVRREGLDFVQSQFADNPAEGLSALLAGSNKVGKGTRMSADAVQAALKGQYIGGLVGDLERAGLFEVFADGAIDQEVARALWAIDTPAELNKLPKPAQDIAKVVRRWQEKARVDANRAGAWVGKADGYIVRQSHDADRLQRGGFDKWKDTILPRLDLDKMFPDGVPAAVNLDKYLNEAYTGIVSGIHETLAVNAEKMGGFKGPGNIAKKLSQGRKLEFKSADDWFSYNQEYGTGNVREAALLGLSRSADATGTMRVLGTNPEANLQSMYEAVRGQMREARDFEGLKKLDSKWNTWIKALAGEVLGRNSAPASRTLATAGTVVRGLNSMAALGGAVVSSVTDIPVRAMEMRYQGQNFLGATLDGLLTPFKRLIESSESAAERKALLAELGYFSEGVSGLLGARFSAADGMPGTMAKAQRLFFKASFLTGWTDVFRDASILATSGHLAALTENSFEKLPQASTRLLQQYGIDKAEWQALREATRTIGDKTVMSPEVVRELPSSKFKALAGERLKGIEATDENAAQIERILNDTREDLAVKLQTLLSDRMNYAIVSPDARARVIANWGQQRGTAAGEIARAVMQFKSFGVGFTQRVVGRETFGYGARRVRDIRSQEVVGIAQLIAATTAFGYIGMAAKDFTKGKEPRSPNDWKTWVAAMQQGGGFGIYGDFLFGEASRFGNSPVETLTGPTLGKVADIWNIVQSAKAGDDPSAKAFRFALNNTPFMNLFYTRLALDYMVFWRLQEYLNPGYLKRMERRTKQENDQEYLLRPSEAAR
jgi:hypothetical protein